MDPRLALNNSALEALGIQVLERGWLSANNVVLKTSTGGLVVDTGYASHADQTAALIRQALGERELERVVNTHLHSDHCGGNAALLAAWPSARVAIPPGQAAAVRDWDAVALTYESTGQLCPRFDYDELLRAGDLCETGTLQWEVHAAPGHDPHAIVLYEPRHRILISGDALWRNGFGVVFPELEGADAFDEVASTLDLIAALRPRTVIPGHGAVFWGDDVADALICAHRRLNQFRAHPAKHRWHALKVLLKFKLLELQRVELGQLQTWFAASDYFRRIAAMDNRDTPNQVLQALLEDLKRSQAVDIRDVWVINR